MSKSLSRWLLSLLIVTALIATSSAEESESVSHELEVLQSVAGSHIVARRFIPSSKRRQGEVRVLRNDSDSRLQVLLYTTLLGRALREMRESENRNWPSGHALHESSQTYLEKLDVFRQYLRGLDDAEENSDTPYKFNVTIELRADQDHSSIRFSEVNYEGRGKALLVTDERVFDEFAIEGDYVRSNMFFIVRDGFELSPEKTRELLFDPTVSLNKD